MLVRHITSPIHGLRSAVWKPEWLRGSGAFCVAPAPVPRVVLSLAPDRRNTKKLQSRKILKLYDTKPPGQSFGGRGAR